MNGFPNPFGWNADPVSHLAGGAASSAFSALTGGLVAWVVDAVVWVVGAVFGFFLNATSPNVAAGWFTAGAGPYATTAGIGAVLLVLFVFAGIIQGVVAGDVGGMLRRMVVDLPTSVLAMVGLVGVTQMLIGITDALSATVMANFSGEIRDFVTVVASLARLGGDISTDFVVFVLGLVTVLAGLVLVAELVIRASLIYIVVALAPLVFAARLWPATKDATQRLVQLLAALILSKLVIAVALAVAAAAAVGAGSGGKMAALAAPEQVGADPGGSLTQAVGILLAALAAFAVAAFSPLLIARLLPMTESAVVAQGLRGAPARVGQQGLMMANTAQMIGFRLGQIAGNNGGGTSHGASNGTDGGADAGRSPLASDGSTGSAGATTNAAASGAGAGVSGGGAAAGAGTGAAGAGASAGGVAAAGPVGAAAGAAGSAAKTAKGALNAGADAAVTSVEWSTAPSGTSRAPASERTDVSGSAPIGSVPDRPATTPPTASPSAPVVGWEPRPQPERDAGSAHGAGDSAPGGPADG